MEGGQVSRPLAGVRMSTAQPPRRTWTHQTRGFNVEQVVSEFERMTGLMKAQVGAATTPL